MEFPAKNLNFPLEIWISCQKFQFPAKKLNFPPKIWISRQNFDFPAKFDSENVNFMTFELLLVASILISRPVLGATTFRIKTLIQTTRSLKVLLVIVSINDTMHKWRSA